MTDTLRHFLRTYGTCPQEGTASGDMEVRADVTGGVWMRVLNRFEYRTSMVGFHYCGVEVRRQGLQAAGQDQGNERAVGSGGGRRSGA